MTSIGILVTGAPPSSLRARYGDYTDMFARLLGPQFDIVPYDVRVGDYPAGIEQHDGYLITGSPAGVHDGEPWIDTLRSFLQSAKGRARLVGICFGHQIMAEAFGGRVSRSDHGWGIGLHRYQIRDRPPWMEDLASVSIAASHQDQVVEQPPATRIVAASTFCPFGILAYQDQPALSFQCHPEFDAGFAKALIEGRRDRLPDPDRALATLDMPDDRVVVASGIRRFLSSDHAQASDAARAGASA